MHNLFIALEGIDGSGKSTQTRLVSQFLGDKGHKVYATSEPTERSIGKLIRQIMKGEIPADDRTIAGLFVADRLDHLLNEENGLVRKMEAGYTVITDRYYFSSYAYHGVHMNMDWVIASNALSAEILKPDATIFIDVPPGVCMDRLRVSRGSIERYETLDNLEKVRDKYFTAFEKLKSSENVIIINGSQTPEDIAADIGKAILAL